jgi:hypothetical protein
MGGWRHAGVLAGLTALAVVACTPASGQQHPAVRDPPVGRHLTHVHAFPNMGIRLAPPTGGRPRLSWRQGYRAARGTRPPWFRSRRLPQVKLADYSDTNRGLVGPVRAWVVVYPDAPRVRLGGPDFRPIPPRPRPPEHCPVYVVVDATSGRSYHWFQSCRLPYRG